MPAFSIQPRLLGCDLARYFGEYQRLLAIGDINLVHRLLVPGSAIGNFACPCQLLV